MIRLEANITRLAPRLGFRCDVDRDRKSREESYTFRMLSPGYYLCICSGGKAYAISETQKTMGCACEDMTYNCTPPYDVCKHLIAFARLPDVPTAPLSPAYEQLLRAAGWTGERLHPPNEQKKKLPPLRDPARQESPRAASRAADRNSSSSVAERVAAMGLQELKRNAGKGGVACIAELERRMAAAMN
uniref:Uncharacterized protein n=1 Tax=Candidatus Methanogaster sp. ANME-2c ERB4 TaxID=2759911 RepID=A0A7G9Y488_9EURY|nr:hypothetical protein HEBJAHIM_00001 [Methanosarcinales archaeon ANME-2c ERB4]QNO42114.1 hypothetical protein INBEEEIC_00016 [Methanosarcinales archaeon ANME-2c ERB4]QNO42272.1 hypothetical protein CCKMDOMK_00001 [Methanosarcinales archaeon ANME-2c ERB4]QNO42480.1 hypothetical protein LBOOMNCC_00033 [Methanosarcinales archaeon ANME-2c ERB4]QNO42565.1 hypothetical protein MMDHCPHC_00001 [Methanosarcinales archaeon ANME-2c ERB4]